MKWHRILWVIVVASAAMTVPISAKEAPDEAARVSDTTTPAPTRFAAPERLMSGETFVGHKRLYPSPVLFDLDADGNAELYIGDLFGYITVTERTAEGWGETARLKDRAGKDIKFSNW